MSNLKKQVPPAKSFISGIRSIGYTFSTSVADIIDNSITAKADIISIFSNPLEKPYFAILDNGLGMTYKELENAMVFGSDRTSKIDDEHELGRFGLGLKTASLAQCRKMIVIGKNNSEVTGMFYDLDIIEEKNEWLMGVLSDEELKEVPHFENLLEYETGVLVVWQEFDKLDSLSSNFVKSFREAVASAKKHVELVFHNFYNTVNIFFDGARIEKRDPFLLDSAPRQQTGRTTCIKIDNSIIKVTPYTLPFANTLTREEKELLGNVSIYDEQGFYIYRNNRLINWGSWLHMNVRSELAKLARVKVEIPSSLDIEWSLDVKKSMAQIPDKIKDQIKAALKDSVSRSKKTIRFKGVQEDKYNLKIWNRTKLRDNKVKYELNKENPLYLILVERIDDEAKKYLNLLIDQIETGLPKYRVQIDVDDGIEVVNDSDIKSKNEIIEQLVEILKNIPETKRKSVLSIMLGIDIYKSVADCKDEILERLNDK